MRQYGRLHFVLAIVGVCIAAAVYLLRRDNDLPDLTGSVPTAGDTEIVSGSRSASTTATEPHFVGLKKCAVCHNEQSLAHANSGHSRTISHSSRSEAARALGGRVVKDPERDYSYHFKFDPKLGLSVSIPEKFSRELPLQYALGSGELSVTFISLLPGEPGARNAGVEHRISIGPRKRGAPLKVTFGQEGAPANTELLHFGKLLVDPEPMACIGCHTTSGKVVQTEVVDLLENVTCESCHGPGSNHVAAAERGSEHPGNLRFMTGNHTPDQQIEMCGRCHRVAEMCSSEMVRREDIRLTRFQPVGIKLSRCYLESDSGMACTTCHDPHRGTNRDPASYTSKCLQCHRKGHPEWSSCPVSATEGCVKCHMPAVPWLHGSFTDHWIRVRDDRDPTPEYPTPVQRKKSTQ